MEAFLGTIMVWPMSWAPAGWQLCDGSLLPISQNQALFSLLGTTYGGNGQTTFAVPDLRGRVPVGVGQGPNLSGYALAQVGGNESNTLATAQLPPTGVNVAIPAVQGANADLLKPGPTALLGKMSGTQMYSDAPADTTLKPFTATTMGTNNLPVENRQPYMAMNFIICTNGFYPSRP